MYRYTAAQEELAAAARGGRFAGDGSPASPGTPAGGWKGGGAGARDAGDADKTPLGFTTLLCIAALLYFYDIEEVRRGGPHRFFIYFVFYSNAVAEEPCATTKVEAPSVVYHKDLPKGTNKRSVAS